jgi:hypothetical protein
LCDIASRRRWACSWPGRCSVLPLSRLLVPVIWLTIWAIARLPEPNRERLRPLAEQMGTSFCVRSRICVVS